MRRAFIQRWAGLIAIGWFGVGTTVLLLLIAAEEFIYMERLYEPWVSLLMCLLFVVAPVFIAVAGVRRGHGISRCCAALLLVYVLTYVALSLAGRYQPGGVGAHGVKWYDWAPYGFFDPTHPWKGSLRAREHPTEKTGGWRSYIMTVFIPLWFYDIHCFHNERFEDHSQPVDAPNERPAVSGECLL